MAEDANTPPRRLEFGDHFRFGVPEIDRAHANLVDLLNAALAFARGTEGMAELMHRFATVYSAHCHAEETYLRSIGYTRLDDHAREHSVISRRINDCYRAFSADPNSARRPLDDLCAAFAEHMLYDLQYKSHLDRAEGQ